MDRKAELEKKRKKLEELRKARESKLVPSTAVQDAASPRVSDNREKERQDVNSLLQSLLGEAATPIPSSPSSGISPSVTPNDSETSTAVRDRGIHKSSVAPRSVPKPPPTLATAPITHITIPPAPAAETYEKGAQTDETLMELLVTEEVERRTHSVAVGDDDLNHEGSLSKVASDMRPLEEADEATPVEDVLLTEEKATALMRSEEFMTFFERSTRLVERALNQPYDFAVDYAAQGEDSSKSPSGRELSLIWHCKNEKLFRGRGVTAVEWSSKYPELFATAYTENASAPNEAPGRVHVWNVHLQERPEFTFTSQSAIMSLRFSSYQPHIVFGGAYSGQLLMWDTRAKSGPVQRTPLSSQAHAYPVYCMDVVGTQNANNLISVSTDGRVCSWATDILAEPSDTLELQSGSKKVAAMAMTFADNDANTFVVGSEDSNLYVCSRHGNNRGIVETLSGHNGPVTGVHYHTSRGEHDFGDLLLSSSTDWTIKLWSRSNGMLIYSFEEASDYVYDVQWSPTHPAVFASVDGQSRLCLWNLNEDTEIPVVTAKVNERGAALNKVRWSADGRRLLVGDVEGHTYVYEQYYNPRSEDWSNFREVLQDLSMFSNAADPEPSR